MVPCYFGASFSPCGAQAVPFPGRPTWTREFPGCSRCRLTAKARHMCRPGTAPVPSTVPLSKWDFARSVPGKFPFLCVMWVRHLCHILQSNPHKGHKISVCPYLNTSESGPLRGPAPLCNDFGVRLDLFVLQLLILHLLLIVSHLAY